MLYRHRKAVIAGTVLAALLTYVITLFLPKWYRAEMTVLPSRVRAGLMDEINSTLLSGLKGFGLSRLGSLGSNEQTSTFLAVLRSRQLADSIIRQFGLMTEYGYRDTSWEECIRDFEENLDYSVEEDGSIRVSMLGRSPQEAVKQVEGIVGLVNDINSDVAASNARLNFEYIQSRYDQCRNVLVALEDTFVVFQKRTRLYALPEQTKAALTVGAEAEARYYGQQITYNLLERMYGQGDPQVAALRGALDDQARAMRSIANGDTTSMLGAAAGLMPPTGKVPELGMEYLRLYREYEIESKVLAILLPMYEQAEIDMRRALPAVVVLDHALLPERKYKPKRLLTALIAALSSAVLLVVYFDVRERVRAALRTLRAEIG